MKGQQGQGSKNGSKIVGVSLKSKPKGKKSKSKLQALTHTERKEVRSSRPRGRAAKPVVINPGGYLVLDGTAPAIRGKAVQLGRVVKAAEKFQAWNKVEGGYVLVGAFDQTDKAIAALGAVGSSHKASSTRGRRPARSGTHK